MDEEDKKQKICRMREEKEFLDEIAGRLARENILREHRREVLKSSPLQICRRVRPKYQKPNPLQRYFLHFGMFLIRLSSRNKPPQSRKENACQNNCEQCRQCGTSPVIPQNVTG